MSTQRIFEDWENYDNRKLRTGDRNYFSCEEQWEVDYLVNKIQKYYNIDANRIKTAIANCCKTVAAPRSRRQFVECVLKNLGLIF